MGSDMGLKSEDQVFSPALDYCVTLGKSHHLLELLSPHLQNAENNTVLPGTNEGARRQALKGKLSVSLACCLIPKCLEKWSHSTDN